MKKAAANKQHKAAFAAASGLRTKYYTTTMNVLAASSIHSYYIHSIWRGAFATIWTWYKAFYFGLLLPRISGIPALALRFFLIWKTIPASVDSIESIFMVYHLLTVIDLYQLHVSYLSSIVPTYLSILYSNQNLSTYLVLCLWLREALLRGPFYYSRGLETESLCNWGDPMLDLDTK